MRLTFKVTGKAHFIKEDFSCNIKVYIQSFAANVKMNKISPAVDFKPCFRVHKSDIKTKNETLWYL